MEKNDYRVSNVVFDYGGVLVQYDFVAFFAGRMGSRQQGQWFMDHVLPEKVGADMDRAEHSFDYYIEQQQHKWPQYAALLDDFNHHYTDVFTNETPGMRQLMLTLQKKGLRLWGLSNWSAKLDDVKRKFDIFKLVEGELVSKDVHLLKPEPAIYRAFLDKFGLDASTCLFIDDKLENIEGCLKVGMHGIRFDRKNPNQSIQEVLALVSKQY